MRITNKSLLVAGMGILVTMGFCSFNDSQAAEAANPKELLQFSGNAIADIAEKAAPAVVNLEMSRKVPVAGLPGSFFSGLPGFPGGNMEFFFNGKKVTPDQFNGSEHNQGEPHAYQEKHDTASGFVIRSDGYILTNAHAVKDQDNIKITLNDKRNYDAKVIGVDYFSDLAVVKIDAKDLPTLSMGTSTGLRPGEFVIAIGSPLGYDHTVTMGIISAVGRSVTDVNGNVNFIQTDAAINPGNSGGPLLNLQGEVIGVNTAIRRDAQNIGFSIPVDIAKIVSDELISKGAISRPWLGIVMKELDSTIVGSLGLPSETKGVMISGFVQGSPGQAAGLKMNDIIIKIDGKDMQIPKEVKDIVQLRKVGDVLNFLILRDGKSQAAAVNVGTYPGSIGPGKLAPSR